MSRPWLGPTLNHELIRTGLRRCNPTTCRRSICVARSRHGWFFIRTWIRFWAPTRPKGCWLSFSNLPANWEKSEKLKRMCSWQKLNEAEPKPPYSIKKRLARHYRYRRHSRLNDESVNWSTSAESTPKPYHTTNWSMKGMKHRATFTEHQLTYNISPCIFAFPFLSTICTFSVVTCGPALSTSPTVY